MKFKITSSFKPTGDQPEAIDQICEGFKNKFNYQTLQGVTGSGKTFTVANVVERLQKPTLVLAHNKTLAAQLYSSVSYKVNTCTFIIVKRIARYQAHK